MNSTPSNFAAQNQETVRSYRRIEQLIPAHWIEATVVANGIRQHYYRTGGHKPPIVLLHGFLEGALTWFRTACALESDYDVIMVDARGHGRSDRITTGFSQELLTEDAAAFIRALQLDAPRVIGQSQGGATGIFVADKYPELVRALIVEGWGDDGATRSNGADFAQSPGYQAWYQAYLRWLEQLKTQSHTERMIASLSQMPPGAPLPPEDEYVPWVEYCAQLDLDLVKLGMSLWSEVEMRQREMVEALKRIDCPVLIMKSAFFPTAGAPASIKEETSDQANIKIVRFENVGHLIHREQLDSYVRVVKEFFAEH